MGKRGPNLAENDDLPLTSPVFKSSYQPETGVHQAPSHWLISRPCAGLSTFY